VGVWAGSLEAGLRGKEREMGRGQTGCWVLVMVSFSFPFLFSNSISSHFSNSNSNEFEFKTHSNKSMHQHECNTKEIKPMINFNYLRNKIRLNAN